jgi:hypothetical protein
VTDPKVYGMIEEAVGALHRSGFREESAQLQAEYTAYRSEIGKRRRDAATAIRERCHPRWLGDLNVPYGEEPYDWIDLLGEIERRIYLRERR